MATTTATARKTPARRPAAPQDRKPKAAPKVLPEQIPGWDLLKPFAEIPVWDQTDMFDALQDFLEEFEAGTLSEMKFVGGVARELLPFAVDEDEFLRFISGPRGLHNATPLVMAWVEQMGKLSPSAS